MRPPGEDLRKMQGQAAGPPHLHDGAPDQAAQHVAAADVGGGHAVGDHVHDRARVVAHHLRAAHPSCCGTPMVTPVTVQAPGCAGLRRPESSPPRLLSHCCVRDCHPGHAPQAPGEQGHATAVLRTLYWRSLPLVGSSRSPAAPGLRVGWKAIRNWEGWGGGGQQ